MKNVRVIARLDIKGPNVVKGVSFECLRVMGKPVTLAEKYYLDGADEIIYIDTVASLYQRPIDLALVHETAKRIFVPFTVGGGIKTIADIRATLKAGADKVAINTAAIRNPHLIAQAAQVFGSQCIVVSIAAKKIQPGQWEAYTDNTREQTGMDAAAWAKKAQELGAGEILLTSVDQDGGQAGFDLELVEAVSKVLSIPLIVSGGGGTAEDFAGCAGLGAVDGVTAASALHYGALTIQVIKKALTEKKVSVRNAPLPQKTVSVEVLGEPGLKNYNSYTVRHLAWQQSETGSARATEAEIVEPANADIGIVNYGINNLYSVIEAFRAIGKSVRLVETPDQMDAVRCLVLPGMGAFADGMDELNQRNLIDTLKQQASSGKPILGICLGMQLLFSESDEFGHHQGLDLIPGRVVMIQSKEPIKIPQIGWNRLAVADQPNPLFADLPENGEVYFAQSYYPVPNRAETVLATTTYGDQQFCITVQKDNIVGTLFHPEKSGEVGLAILKNFCRYYHL
ncbi:MAG: hypothetical protein A3J59_03445 [Candidatus Buchananbacteria bacterium RIFCSPHIGHO2_02_FULL_56_16]|uniref:Imidazole glycerol phosphate synthase subunit HisH n=1 Tax=Candidatus Buchananbacteria bacterium RIFCSPHIGHO2_02_FULL_56_16 TaxID=1797542 RepID=A0A1G1YKI0_9BACT|nr:MAG: hypothetical protein A3J59_03445 [Candidatus Buchananbacteria bacterium RIFCSPHIGHO2_02_FULL_56_16]